MEGYLQYFYIVLCRICRIWWCVWKTLLNYVLSNFVRLQCIRFLKVIRNKNEAFFLKGLLYKQFFTYPKSLPYNIARNLKRNMKIRKFLWSFCVRVQSMYSSPPFIHQFEYRFFFALTLFASSFVSEACVYESTPPGHFSWYFSFWFS